jgi:hypothetical protein
VVFIFAVTYTIYCMCCLFISSAGTHDMNLMLSTLTKLKEFKGGKDSSTVRIPVYDKSLRGGRGDRSEQSQWTNITGKLTATATSSMSPPYE